MNEELYKQQINSNVSKALDNLLDNQTRVVKTIGIINDGMLDCSKNIAANSKEICELEEEVGRIYKLLTIVGACACGSVAGFIFMLLKVVLM